MESKDAEIDVGKMSLDDLSKMVKKEYKESTPRKTAATEEKIFLLGFMPQSELASFLLAELEENFDLDRMKKLWLPKVANANRLTQIDPYMITDSNINQVVQDIDSSYKPKLEEIENKLLKYPFWTANSHSIKMISIDHMISFQSNVSLNRVSNLSKNISKNSAIPELLDYSIDFNRKNDEIHYNLSGPDSFIFTSDDNDVRPTQPAIRMLPRYMKDGKPLTKEVVPSFVIQITQGEPFVYCIRTWGMQQNPDGSLTKRYLITLQNGIHRAYAVKALGFTHMPCILIDPTLFQETDLLMSNWPPDRRQQGMTIRPPLMKDFFNPDIIEKFEVRKKKTQIRINWKTEKFFS